MRRWDMRIGCPYIFSSAIQTVERSSGGIIGRTSLGLMFIDLVYLPETLRGHDIGARMMGLAEEEARRRGWPGVLYTISFQAPGFYKRLGWRVFGEIPCDPPGTSRIFLTKYFR